MRTRRGRAGSKDIERKVREGDTYREREKVRNEERKRKGEGARCL